MRLTNQELKTIEREVDTLSDKLDCPCEYQCIDCFEATRRLEELQLRIQQSIDLEIKAESKDLPHNVLPFKRRSA